MKLMARYSFTHSIFMESKSGEKWAWHKVMSEEQWIDSNDTELEFKD